VIVQRLSPKIPGRAEKKDSFTNRIRDFPSASIIIIFSGAEELQAALLVK
jgi:hypothetical protein